MDSRIFEHFETSCIQKNKTYNFLLERERSLSRDDYSTNDHYDIVKWYPKS